MKHNSFGEGITQNENGDGVAYGFGDEVDDKNSWREEWFKRWCYRYNDGVGCGKGDGYGYSNGEGYGGDVDS